MNKTTRQPGKGTSSENRRVDFHGDTSEDENIEILDFISRSTRSGANKMKQIVQRIKEFEDNSVLVDDDSNKCVICFENKRNVLLMPCSHLHLCHSCWYILKVKHIGSQPNSYFDDDIESDEHYLKPKCPVCRTPVDSETNVRG